MTEPTAQPLTAVHARWECASGPFDDDPYCAAEPAHTCPTIRVHPDDVARLTALVDEMQRLRVELARTAARSAALPSA